MTRGKINFPAGTKVYLGDSVYAMFLGHFDARGIIKLTTENGLPNDPSNEIFLDTVVMAQLLGLWEALPPVVGLFRHHDFKLLRAATDEEIALSERLDTERAEGLRADDEDVSLIDVEWEGESILCFVGPA